MKQPLGKKKDRVFWWSLSCVHSCRYVDVEFCGWPSQLPQLGVGGGMRITLGRWSPGIYLMSDGRGPGDSKWKDHSNSWQPAELWWASLANTCSFGLGSYFSQIPNHWTSLSLAHKEIFPSPHLTKLIIVNLQFYSWDSGISRGQPSSVALASYRMKAKWRLHDILKARHILNTKYSPIFQLAPVHLLRQCWWLRFIYSALEKLFQRRRKASADKGSRNSNCRNFAHWNHLMRTISLFPCSTEKETRKVRAETLNAYQD